MESTSALSGEHTARWLHFLLGIFGPISPRRIMLINDVVRKIGHFTGYALLSWFTFRGWMETLFFQTERTLRRRGKHIEIPRRWHFRAAVLAVLCTVVVSALDEFHQAHIPGRTGVFQDVILDGMGALFAQFCLLLYWTRSNRTGPNVGRRAGSTAGVVVNKA